MSGSPRDRAPAASVASARVATEGRRPEGAATCTSDAGTARGAEKESGAAAVVPVVPPTGAERACLASDAGPEIATEDNADVLTSALPPVTQQSHPAPCHSPRTAVTRQRSECSLADGSGRCGNCDDTLSGVGVAELSKTEAGKLMRQPERGTPAGRGAPTPAGRGAPPTGGSPEPPPPMR